MAISHDFLNKLRAMKDGGLNLSFEDLIKGMERAFDHVPASGMYGVSGEDVLKWTEEACRKRVRAERNDVRVVFDMTPEAKAAQKEASQLLQN